MALKNDGSVVAWGHNEFGQTDVPDEAQSGVVAIAAGSAHTIALVIPSAPIINTQPVSQTVNAGQSASFTVVARGYPLNYQWRKDETNLSGATDFTYHLGNAWFSDAGSYTVVVSNYLGSVTTAPPAMLAVNAAPPGSVVAWGENSSGQTSVPLAAQSGVVAIAAGGYHTVALKSDGSVLAWGADGDGQTDVPVPAQSGVRAIAAGGWHTVALKFDGSVVAWGYNAYGQTNVPVAAQNAVEAGDVGCLGQHAFEQFDGVIVASGPKLDHGQAAQGIDMTRLQRQHPSIDALGLAAESASQG